jgi:hypothetical protein
VQRDPRGDEVNALNAETQERSRIRNPVIAAKNRIRHMPAPLSLSLSLYDASRRSSTEGVSGQVHKMLSEDLLNLAHKERVSFIRIFLVLNILDADIFTWRYSSPELRDTYS